MDEHEYAAKVRSISDALSMEEENESDEEIAEIVSLLDKAATLLESRGSSLLR